MDTTEESGSTGLDDVGGASESIDPVQDVSGAADAGTDSTVPPPAEASGQPQRLTRAQRHDVVKERLEAQRRERVALEHNRRLQETIERLNENVSKLAPKQPGPRDEARDRWLKAAKKLDPNDPTTMTEFLEATAGYSTAGAQDELVKQVLEKIQPQLPAQRPEPVRKILSEFSWAAEDNDLQEEIALETRRAARRRNISLEGIDATSLYRLMREGAIAVAKANNLPIPGANGRDGTAVSRFAGTSGRAGASAGGSPGPISSDDRQRIIEATASMGGEYRGKSAEERVAMFVRKHIRS